MRVKPFFFDLNTEEITEFQEGAAKILQSGTLILGDYTAQFEKAFAEYIESKHAIAVNSGSTALEILLRLKGVVGKRVLVPTNTNFATVAAIIRAGGIVEYLDMDRNTFAPSLAMVKAELERHPDIAGVAWVHIGGIISPEVPAVVEYCRDRRVFVIEDAAHAHGSQLGGVKSGRLADGAAFSFFPTKVMTTCEGGMITTESDEEDYLARSHRNQVKRGVSYGGLHHDFGNSSRMTELHALLGLIQLRKLPEMLRRRAAATRAITRQLDKAGIEYCSTSHMDMASNYKLIVLLPDGQTLESVKKALAAEGVTLGGGVYELPCHRQPVFEGICAGQSYPTAERWCPNHICPPLTSGMTEDEAGFVGEMLVKHLA
ncbi:MAG: DegT/DnrJ/EryC1/StrS family aminotransferase [candidate division NC10 bacterium]|nr:DegT/DnrJ/EryC1/StrS family aminotransferase [candidate division NC10 bacterium]